MTSWPIGADDSDYVLIHNRLAFARLTMTTSDDDENIDLPTQETWHWRLESQIIPVLKSWLVLLLFYGKQGVVAGEEPLKHQSVHVLLRMINMTYTSRLGICY